MHGIGPGDLDGAESTTELPPRTEPAGPTWEAVVGSMLRSAHDMASNRPIRVPDETGAIGTVWPAGLFTGTVPPVVADANVVRRDISYRCRRDRRTVLVTAANGDSIRLFCASHVIDEVFEHAPRWAGEQGIDLTGFLKCWTEEYVPLIREVRPTDLEQACFTPSERRRLADLTDADDRPSAALAILLGAFYLSTDRRALGAVYGPGVDLTEHDAWLATLMAGGDAGELSKLLFGALSLTRIAGAVAREIVRRTVTVVPPALLAAAVVGIAAGHSGPRGSGCNGWAGVPRPR